MFNLRFFSSLLFCLFVHLLTFAQPANDKIENAIELTPSYTPNPTNGDLTNATTSLINVTPNVTPLNIDVWYKFTPTTKTVYLNINSGTGGFQVNFELYSGSGSPLVLTKISSLLNNTSISISDKVIPVEPGKIYYYRVFHKSNPITASYSKTFTTFITTPPINDECTGAIALTPGIPGENCTSVAGDNTRATGTSPTITSCSGTADDDVWYSFVATSTNHVLDVKGGSSYTPVIQIFNGSNCPIDATNVINCNKASGTNKTASITYNNFLVGSTYYFRVYDNANTPSTTPTFDICLKTPPTNDECGNDAIELFPESGSVCNEFSSSFKYATKSSQATTNLTPIICIPHTNDVWFKFKPAAVNQWIRVLGEAGVNVAFQVFSSCGGTNMNCINVQNAGKVDSVAVTGLNTSNYYYLRVFDADNSATTSAFNFKVCIFSPPANDDCSGAVTLSSNKVCTTTDGELYYSSKTNPAPSADKNDVWYSFVAKTSSHYINVYGHDQNFQAGIEVYQGACGTASFSKLTPANSLFTNTITSLNATIAGLTPNQKYYYRVFNNGTNKLDTTTFSTCVEDFIRNNECAGADTLIAGKPGEACSPNEGRIQGATLSSNLPTCSSTNSDVWYIFKATNAKHFISVTGAKDLDVAFQFYPIASNCSSSSLPCVNSNTITDKGGTETKSFSNLTPNDWYYIRVFSINSTTTTPYFNICITTPPSNDDCPGAIELKPDQVCTGVFGDGTFASQSFPSKNSTLYGDANDDLWYKFKADTTVAFISVSASTTYNAVVEVFEGPNCPTATSISKFINDDKFNPDQFGNVAVLGLTKNQTYYYRVYDREKTTTDYSFTTCVVKPVINDDCNKAIVVKPTYACKMLDGDGTYASPTTFASKTNANDDVWYKFDATSSKYSISINASLNYIPTIEVYSSCTNTTPVITKTLTQACQDDAGKFSMDNLTAGTTYYYRVYNNYDNSNTDVNKPATYTFSTCVSMSPKNDDCGANATVVSAGDACSSVISDAEYATKSGFVACETSGDANDDLWFTFTAQNTTQFINVKADDYQYNPVVQLFTKNCVALSGTNFCDDVSYLSNAKDNKVYFTGLTKNTEYMYRVYDHSGTNPDTMTFKTCVVNPVKNDDCAGAKSVTVGKTCTSTQGDGTYASLSFSSVAGTGTPNDDVWFTFVPTKSEMYLSVEPTDKNYDPVVQVFKGPNCPTSYGQKIKSEDASFPVGSFGNMKLTGLTPGVTYYYCVYDVAATNPDTMTFNTCVVEATENDDCKGALNITPGETYIPTDGDGTYATQSMPACNSANKANDDVWFKFKAERDTQFITVIPTNPIYKPVIQVFKDCPLSGSPTPLTTNNCINSLNKGSLFTNGIILTKGTTYYYRVYDFEESNIGKMTFTTGVVNPVSNDACVKATEVTASSICNSVQGDGTYAFQSLAGCPGTVDADDDVWFKFKPINDSQVIYVDPSIGYDPVVEVFSGCGLSSGASIPVSGTCNDVRFPAGGKGSNLITGLNTAAPYYYYRVFDAKTGKSSALTFTTCVTDPPKPPANDNPCNAILINPEQTCKLETYTNEGATASLGIPTPGCAGYVGGDVWFKVKVPFSGQLTFTLKELVIKGGGMAIYSGSCTNMKLITCDGGNTSMPTIALNKLTPGEFLWIRIWEHTNDNNGTFKLCVTKPNEAPLVGSCANQDFESDLVHWFGSTGKSIKGNFDASSPNYAPDKFGISTPETRFKIMTSGIDPVGGFKTVYNGGKSIRLGSNETGGIGQSVEQYFPVTQANSSFTYNYAVVLQSGDHPAPEQPFFKVELFDDDGVQIGCGDYLVAAPKTGVGDNIGLIKSPKFTNVTYKPWSKVNINLRPYIGKNVHIRFSVGDCSNKGHYGYVYLDCECKPFEISSDPDIYIKPSKYCVGDSVKLYAPKGALSYQWKEVGSSTVPSTVNMTRDSLVYKTTGAGTPTFTCEVTLFGTSLCPANLPITLDIGATPNLVVTDPDSVCFGEKIDISDPAIMTGSATGLNTIKYFTDKAHTIPVIDPKNILSGTKYYFRAEKSASCFADSAINVVFNPLPTATISGDLALCKNKPNPDITFTGATGKAPYTFTYEINSGGNSTIQTSSGNSVTVSAPTTNAGSFDYNLLSVKDANGCSQTQAGKATIKVNEIVVTTISCGTPTTSTVEFKWTNNTAATGGYEYTYTSNSTPQKTGFGVLSVGTNKINLDPTPSFGLDETVIFILTPKGDPCGNPSTGTCKTLNCTPPVVPVTPKKVLCDGDVFTGIKYTSNDASATFTWTNGFVASSKIGQIASDIRPDFPTFIAENTTKEPILDTIFVKATSLACESPAMEHYITVNPKGQVDKPADIKICTGQETTKIIFSTHNSGGITTYDWTNSDPSIGLGGLGSGDISKFKTINTGTTPKVATITVTPKFTNDGTSCTGIPETFTITVNPLPTITATNSGPICGTTASFTLDESGGNATKWSWSSIKSATYTSKNVKNPTVSNAVDGQEFKVIGTDANGCVDSAKTNLVVKPLPVFTPSVDTACVDGILTFKAKLPSEPIYPTYLWTYPDGTTNTSNTFTINPVSIVNVGKYYIKVTDNIGCSKTDSVQAIVNPYPKISDITKSICYGGIFDTIPNNTIPNIVPSGTTYTWILPTSIDPRITGITTGTDQTSFTQNLTNPTNSVITVSYEVTASSGKAPNKCSSKFDVSIKLNPKPAIANINKTLCSTELFDTIPKSTILTPNIVPIGTTYSWLLPTSLTGIDNASAEIGKASFNQKLTNTTANPIDVSYTITATSVPIPEECSSTFNSIIRVNPTPKISNISLAICSGETFDTIPNNNNNVNIIPTGTKYAWNITTPPTGITGITSESNQSSIKQTLKNTTTTPINVTYIITATSGTSSYTCSNTFNLTVKVNPTPIIKAENSGPICANVKSFTLDETATDAISWKWSSNKIAKFDDEKLEKPKVTEAADGEIFKVIGKDANGCIDSATTKLIINPIPVITPKEVCVDKQVILTATHIPATSNAWKSENVGIATIDPLTGEMLGIAAGKGKIVYLDDKGCSDTSIVTINALPKITTSPLEVCEESTLQLKANHTAAPLNSWKSSVPAFATISNIGLVQGIKTGVSSIEFTDSKGCTTKEDLAVNIKPIANFKAVYESICVTDTLFLIDKSKPLSHKYIWSFGDGLSSNKNTHKYLTGGIFDITLVTITDKGCMDTMTKNKYIEVIGLPKVTFSFTPDSIDIFDPQIRFMNHSNAKHYEWVFGDGLPISVQENPIHTFPATTGQHYTVTLTGYNTENGCSTSYSQMIVAKEPLIYYIPNTFTPNGDEFNNVFKPVFYSGLDVYNYHFIIYNRWGELIFESFNVDYGWDGTYGDQIEETATYIWKLEFKEKNKENTHSKTGHVNVLR